MKWLTSLVRTRVLASVTVLVAGISLEVLAADLQSAPAAAAAPPAQTLHAGNWQAAAKARIEQHRKADARITVVDAAGNPVPDVELTVKQTRHAFLFGCNIFAFDSYRQQRDTDTYRHRFKDLFNYATLPFYWPSYERRRGQPRHAELEHIARWCRANHITTKGHPLAWNFADPAWLPEDPDVIRQLQLARIRDCVTRFHGLIDIWDVVNEATHFDRESFQQRAPKLTRMWKETGQIEFVAQCFRAAREANPSATLLINDYRTDPAYGKLMRQLIAAMGKRPFDVIGIQSHMHNGIWSNDKLWEVCERFSQFHVPLHFTELTVVSGKSGWELARREGQWQSTPEGEVKQAEDTVRIYTMLFSYPAVTAITWWDLGDRHAWQRAPAGLLRKDLSPKPAYEQLHDLIRRQWWTQTTVRTDAQGRATFRGFLGDYDIRATPDDSKPANARLKLRKDGANSVTLRLSTSAK